MDTENVGKANCEGKRTQTLQNKLDRNVDKEVKSRRLPTLNDWQV
jgi:hypothetical protein